MTRGLTIALTLARSMLISSTVPEQRLHVYQAARDPDGARGRAFFQAAFERERWGAVRELARGLLAMLSVPLWLAAGWPGLLGDGTRLALALWAMDATLFAWAVVAEHRRQRILDGYAPAGRDSAPGMERDAALALLHERLALATDAHGVWSAGAEVAAQALRARVVVLAAASGALVPVASAPPGIRLTEDELATARLSLERGHAAGLGVDAAPRSSCLCVLMSSGQRVQGVLAVVPEEPVPLHPERARLLVAIARETAHALERLDVASR